MNGLNDNLYAALLESCTTDGANCEMNELGGECLFAHFSLIMAHISPEF